MAGTPLTLDEREEIRVGLEADDSCAAIGRRLGRAGSTISREVRRNGRRHGYRAARAQLHTDKRRCRPKVPKLVADPALGAAVERDLREGFSPAAIAVRLAAGGPATVVAETIYQALYSRTFRGIKLLPKQCLRTRRRRRKPRARAAAFRHWRTSINLIDGREASALDRREAGHWEGDLIVGPSSGSAIVTLVERTSRLTVLGLLSGRHGPTEVLDALIGGFEGVPSHLRRSLTWDQGLEMARWAALEDLLALPVYFCDPHSPWQRPSNENTNRQLRYWFPKGTDLHRYDQTALNQATNVLNNTPRRSLDWDTPAQRYVALAMR